MAIQGERCEPPTKLQFNLSQVSSDLNCNSINRRAFHALVLAATTQMISGCGDTPNEPTTTHANGKGVPLEVPIRTQAFRSDQFAAALLRLEDNFAKSGSTEAVPLKAVIDFVLNSCQSGAFGLKKEDAGEIVLGLLSMSDLATMQESATVLADLEIGSQVAKTIFHHLKSNPLTGTISISPDARDSVTIYTFFPQSQIANKNIKYGTAKVVSYLYDETLIKSSLIDELDRRRENPANREFIASGDKIHKMSLDELRAHHRLTSKLLDKETLRKESDNRIRLAEDRRLIRQSMKSRILNETDVIKRNMLSASLLGLVACDDDTIAPDLALGVFNEGNLPGVRHPGERLEVATVISLTAEGEILPFIEFERTISYTFNSTPDGSQIVESAIGHAHGEELAPPKGQSVFAHACSLSHLKLSRVRNDSGPRQKEVLINYDDMERPLPLHQATEVILAAVDEFKRNATRRRKDAEAVQRDNKALTKIIGLDITDLLSARKVAWQPKEIANAVSSTEQLHRMLKSGRISLISVSATWCGACKILVPELAKIDSSFPGKGQVIEIFSGDDPSNYEGLDDSTSGSFKWVRDNISYPVAIAAPGLMKKLNAESLPILILVDGQGKIRWAETGSGRLLQNARTEIDKLQKNP